MRRSGAVGLGPGVWTMPDTPAYRQGLERVGRLVARAKGEVIELAAHPRNDADAIRLADIFNTERQAEWVEFVAECGKFEAEIAHEIEIAKLTLAELEEEEQSYERLRRWHRDLKTRDVFGIANAYDADARLRRCRETLDDYADRVYAALHQD